MLPANVEKQIAREKDGCWLWLGQQDKDGYGRVWIKNRKFLVHRLVYLDVVGSVPDGLVLDHMCNVPPCCNPLHLRVCTSKDNVRRSRALYPSIKNECKEGHHLTPDNTRLEVRKNGWVTKVCRECDRIRHRKAKP